MSDPPELNLTVSSEHIPREIAAVDLVARTQPLVVSYGGGVNSVAMLVGLHARGIRPDAITFADTGGEKPETYSHILRMDAWAQQIGFPGITIVRYQATLRSKRPYTTLEASCLGEKMLPSIAYGYKSCSHKWKILPQDHWVSDWELARAAWRSGQRVIKTIGYDFDESHRGKIRGDDNYIYAYPLVEWEWGRGECIAAIERAGLPVPAKSSCFFCPSSKKVDIDILAKLHPDLLARAIAMEDNARDNLQTVKGLGRSWAWKDYVAGQTADARDGPDVPCGCYDGE